MTIVARFTVQNHPLLIGDALLSGYEQVGQYPNIPTVGDTRSVYPEGSGFGITGLRQKINILAENLVVGWAGGRSIATTVIKEFREQNSKHPFTVDGLQAFFKNCEAVVKDQAVGFAGYLREHDSAIAVFNFTFNAKDVTFSSDLFGDVWLLGTGCDSLRKYLESVRDIPLPILQKGLKPNAVEIAIPFALHLTGIALEDEIRRHESLRNLYGGGYEVATLRKGNFTKLDDITYMFWYADINGQHIEIKPHKAFKYKYYGDLLAIRTLNLEDNGRGTMTLDDSANHLISPIYRDATEEEIDKYVIPNMNSKFTCNYFLVRHANQVMNVFTKIDYIHSGSPNMTFTEIKDGLVFGFKGSFVHEVAANILNEFMNVQAKNKERKPDLMQ